MYPEKQTKNLERFRGYFAQARRCIGGEQGQGWSAVPQGGVRLGGAERASFLGNESRTGFVYTVNKAASLRAATLSPTNQPRTETPVLFRTNPFTGCDV